VFSHSGAFLCIAKSADTNAKPFTCQICRHRFSRNDALRRHFRSLHPEQKFLPLAKKRQFTVTCDGRHESEALCALSQIPCEHCALKGTKSIYQGEFDSPVSHVTCLETPVSAQTHEKHQRNIVQTPIIANITSLYSPSLPQKMKSVSQTSSNLSADGYLRCPTDSAPDNLDNLSCGRSFYRNTPHSPVNNQQGGQ
jgi:hypothetical protein